MKPIITKLNYTYKKEDSNVWVLNKADIPVNFDKVKDEQIVHLAPGSVGGNHKHPRIEWFTGIGELYFHWIDETGNKKSEHMNPDGEILLIEVPSYLSHAVENRSEEKFGILFEMADGKMEDVEKVNILT